MKQFIIKFCLLLAIFSLSASSALASGEKSQKIIHIQASEIITTSIYALADEIIIDGTINGDLMAISKKITVNGQIDGDLIAISSETVVNGPIGGNIRVLGESVHLNSLVSRNITIAASKITLGESSRISWDAYLAGKNISTAGKIDGSLKALAIKADLSGEITGDAEINIITNEGSNELNLSSVSIGGNLTYQATKNASIDALSNIKGEIYPNITTLKENKIPSQIAWGKMIYKIISAFIFGVLIIILGRKHLSGLFGKIVSDPQKLIVPGLMLFFGTPLIAIIIFITLIGIPLSLIIFLLWLVLQYLAKIIIIIFCGQWMIKLVIKEKPFNLIWALILGIIIAYLLFSIPVIGKLLSLLASLAGLGALYLYVNNKSRSL